MGLVQVPSQWLYFRKNTYLLNKMSEARGLLIREGEQFIKTLRIWKFMNMNRGVCRPTENIRIKSIMEDERPKPTKGVKVSEIIDEIILCKIGAVSESCRKKEKGLDFYEIVADPEKESKCNRITCEETYISTHEDKNIHRREKIDFLTLGLQNDMRVRWHKIEGREILVKFWSVTDAISYYRQHISMAEMEFIEITDMDVWSSAVKLEASPPEHKRRQDMVLRKESDLPLDERRKLFKAKVEGFDNKKNFFTKFDVKRMEAMRLSGKYDFLFENSKEIACGCASNVVMQDAVKFLSEDQLCRLINLLGQDIAPLAATKHGAYAIQAVIGRAQAQIAQKLICANFRKYGEFLMCHEIGNYAIQRVLLFDCHIVFSLCMRNFTEIISDPLGFKIFKKNLIYFSGHYNEIEEAIEEHIQESNEKNCRAILSMINGSKSQAVKI